MGTWGPERTKTAVPSETAGVEHSRTPGLRGQGRPEVRTPMFLLISLTIMVCGPTRHPPVLRANRKEVRCANPKRAITSTNQGLQKLKKITQEKRNLRIRSRFCKRIKEKAGGGMGG